MIERKTEPHKTSYMFTPSYFVSQTVPMALETGTSLEQNSQVDI
jgi:hypothetical protein